MKKAFSLLEIIIGILIIGLVSSFAIPKLLDTKDFASATTLKRDIFSIVSSFQTYRLTNSTVSDINDVVQLNESIWEIDGTKISDKSGCVTLEYDEDAGTLELTNNNSTSTVCTKLYDDGIDTKTYEL